MVLVVAVVDVVVVSPPPEPRFSGGDLIICNLHFSGCFFGVVIVS